MESASQRKWRLIRERQEAKAKERADAKAKADREAKRKRARARKAARNGDRATSPDPDGYDRDNLGESPDY